VEAGAVDPALQRLLEQARPRRLMPLGARERAIEAVTCVLFVAVVAVMAGTLPAEPDWSWPKAIVLAAAYAVFSRVRFDVGAGYTIPTQLVFVPMFLLLPPATVPIVVAVATAAARLPNYVRGGTHPDRVLLVPGDAFYAVGPAIVIGALGDGTLHWDDWPIFLLALVAQLGIDVVVSTAREWAATGVPPRLQLRVLAWVYAVDTALAPVGLLAAFAAAEEFAALLCVVPLVAILKLFARERQTRIEQSIELSRAYRGTAQLLGDVIEDDDAYTGQHTKGVVLLADLVAEELKLDEQTRRDAEFGALLHDVGKIAIPKEIIHKPGPLDEHEWEVMRTHTLHGQKLLERVGGPLERVGRVVRASHERWDGKGYPDGLAGDAIPVAARIVAACDAYNAMTTDRPYRSALPVHVALAELRDNAGTQFDPAVVEALLLVITRWDPEMVADSPRSDELDAAIAELLGGGGPTEDLEDEDDWPAAETRP
jgi:hypothetical protein